MRAIPTYRVYQLDDNIIASLNSAHNIEYGCEGSLISSQNQGTVRHNLRNSSNLQVFTAKPASQLVRPCMVSILSTSYSINKVTELR